MITREDIDQAQRSWGDALIEVGASASWEEAHARATKMVKQHYRWGDDAVLFCPTRASDQQFRSTIESAVAYFVGRNPNHSEDHGFALQPWVSVRFENSNVVCLGGVGLAMGNYFFGQADGSEVKVEYSFAYACNDTGVVQIQLHHSAMPFSG
jgi:hypothetical protein